MLPRCTLFNNSGNKICFNLLIAPSSTKSCLSFAIPIGCNKNNQFLPYRLTFPLEICQKLPASESFVLTIKPKHWNQNNIISTCAQFQPSLTCSPRAHAPLQNLFGATASYELRKILRRQDLPPTDGRTVRKSQKVHPCDARGFSLSVTTMANGRGQKRAPLNRILSFPRS